MGANSRARTAANIAAPQPGQSPELKELLSDSAVVAITRVRARAALAANDPSLARQMVADTHAAMRAENEAWMPTKSPI